MGVNYTLEKNKFPVYTVVFESYRELHFIYLSHINDESNILSCHDHFIEILHAKKTSVNSLKTGFEENKRQHNSTPSHRLRTKPLKMVLLEFQVANDISSSQWLAYE